MNRAGWRGDHLQAPTQNRRKTWPGREAPASGPRYGPCAGTKMRPSPSRVPKDTQPHQEAAPSAAWEGPTRPGP